MSKIAIRDGEATDHPFVKDTIRKSLLDYSAYFKHLSAPIFGVLMDPIVAAHRLLVAMPVDSPADIIGFILFDPPAVVSFVYVRNDMRRGGVATALLHEAGIAKGDVETPFLTTKINGSNFPRLAEAKGYRVRFRPYLPLEIAATLFRAASG